MSRKANIPKENERDDISHAQSLVGKSSEHCCDNWPATPSGRAHKNILAHFGVNPIESREKEIFSKVDAHAQDREQKGQNAEKNEIDFVSLGKQNRGAQCEASITFNSVRGEGKEKEREIKESREIETKRESKESFDSREKANARKESKESFDSREKANAKICILSMPKEEKKVFLLRDEIKNKSDIKIEKEISREVFMSMSKEEKKEFLSRDDRQRNSPSLSTSSKSVSHHGENQGQKAEGGLTPSVRIFLGSDGKRDSENKRESDNRQKMSDGEREKEKREKVSDGEREKEKREKVSDGDFFMREERRKEISHAHQEGASCRNFELSEKGSDGDSFLRGSDGDLFLRKERRKEILHGPLEGASCRNFELSSREKGSDGDLFLREKREILHASLEGASCRNFEEKTRKPPPYKFETILYPEIVEETKIMLIKRQCDSQDLMSDKEYRLDREHRRCKCGGGEVAWRLEREGEVRNFPDLSNMHPQTQHYNLSLKEKKGRIGMSS